MPRRDRVVGFLLRSNSLSRLSPKPAREFDAHQTAVCRTFVHRQYRRPELCGMPSRPSHERSKHENRPVPDPAGPHRCDDLMTGGLAGFGRICLAGRAGTRQAVYPAGARAGGAAVRHPRGERRRRIVRAALQTKRFALAQATFLRQGRLFVPALWASAGWGQRRPAIRDRVLARGRLAPAPHWSAFWLYLSRRPCHRFGWSRCSCSPGVPATRGSPARRGRRRPRRSRRTATTAAE